MKYTFLAVDYEALALEDLTTSLKEAAPEDDICAFTSPSAALKAVQCGQIQPDIAFLDIQMRGWTGLRLAGELRKTLPQLEIVFVTAHPQYALESYSLHARGYLIKPVTAQAVRKELDIILCERQPCDVPALLQVSCFGNFEVFYGGKPLKFSRAKSKELFAYLIYRCGATCSAKEITAILFEDREHDSALKNQVQTFKSDLLKTLRSVGCEDVLIKGRNCLGVAVEMVDCDYYRLLQGDARAIDAFVGEFMSQYSWAEPTTAMLFYKYLQ